MEILIINTGVGNLESIKNILNRIGLASKISSLDEDFKKYNKFIIPGVGNFDRAMNELKAYSSFELIKNKEFLKGKFVLGICLGMQLLFEESEEGKEKGLALFKGKVKKFKNDKLRIPHMGWNNVYGKNFYSDLNNEKFYFAHSYYVECKEEYIYAYSDYSIKFPAIVRQNNFYGIQFHPEKSNQNGMELLKKILR